VDPKWFNVNEDAQIWSGHANSAHKQFVLVAPAAIRAIDEYQGSYQFEQARGIAPDGTQYDLTLLLDPGYPQAWIREHDVSLLPFEDEPDDEDEPEIPPVEEAEWSDVLIGTAVRIILDHGGSVSFP